LQFVALVRAPAQPEQATQVFARGAGLTLAEARLRLAPEPPLLLARLERDRAGPLVAELRRAGLAALAVDTRVPSDRERTLVRSFSLSAAGATFRPRAGEPLEVPWCDVLAVLRGVRSSRSAVERTETSRRFSVGTAVATGGLGMTRLSKRTVRSSEETSEQVILVYARDGRAASLAERELDFACLAPGMQPSSTANMGELARRLREKATSALHDERLLRLGRRPLPFVGGGESRTGTSSLSKALIETSGSLDVLAEVMRQAVVARLLP
jgi:hypothetical protein